MGLPLPLDDAQSPESAAERGDVINLPRSNRGWANVIPFRFKAGEDRAKACGQRGGSRRKPRSLVVLPLTPGAIAERDRIYRAMLAQARKEGIESDPMVEMTARMFAESSARVVGADGRQVGWKLWDALTRSLFGSMDRYEAAINGPRARAKEMWRVKTAALVDGLVSVVEAEPDPEVRRRLLDGFERVVAQLVAPHWLTRH